ncbi:MAG: DNA polymerase III subunit chi [Gammaproteobacteria bacterium]|nr:DNA polymerase III subunit chi [Gammaproteobacteria bacterium]
MRADFYLLNTPQAEIRTFTCRLLQKIYQKKLSTYLYVQHTEKTKEWDHYLWTFNDVSFLPHQCYTLDITSSAPILIGSIKPQSKQDVLINLTDSVPDFCEQFPRVVEIVSSEETEKSLARKKYQHYRTLGFQLHTNAI